MSEVKTWQHRLNDADFHATREELMQAEIDELRVELAKSKQCLQGSNKELDNVKQVEFPKKCEAVANGWRGTVERLEKKLAELETLYLNSLADATQWQLYKARKDAVISAGMGRKAMRDLLTADAPTCTSDEWLANCPQSVRDLADKIKAGLALQPHQQRVVDEKTELDAKREKLMAFFSTAMFHSLPESEQSRLLSQGTAMRTYSEILGERIANF